MEDFIQAFFHDSPCLAGQYGIRIFFNFKSGPRLKEQT